MADRISPVIRSRIMGRVKGRDTKPEMQIRRLVHGLGYRYRLHIRELPGTPDIVFRNRKKAIFVHGCFWHQHSCPRGTRPTSNKKFWNAKLDKNIRRDAENISNLAAQGWAVLVVWECETKNIEQLRSRIRDFLQHADSCST